MKFGDQLLFKELDLKSLKPISIEAESNSESSRFKPLPNFALQKEIVNASGAIQEEGTIEFVSQSGTINKNDTLENLIGLTQKITKYPQNEKIEDGVTQKIGIETIKHDLDQLIRKYVDQQIQEIVRDIQRNQEKQEKLQKSCQELELKKSQLEREVSSLDTLVNAKKQELDKSLSLQSQLNKDLEATLAMIRESKGALGKIESSIQRRLAMMSNL